MTRLGNSGARNLAETPTTFAAVPRFTVLIPPLIFDPVVSDHREATRQGDSARLQLPVASRNMQSRTCLQAVAADRVRHASLEERVPAAGNQRAARQLVGQSAALDQVSRHYHRREKCREFWQITLVPEICLGLCPACQDSL